MSRPATITFLFFLSWSCFACGEVKIENAPDAMTDCDPACETGFSCVDDQCVPTEDVVEEPTCTDGEQNGDEEDVDCGGSSCVACAECTLASDCASGSCMPSGSCATTRSVPCSDAPPANATSIAGEVVIVFTPGTGWSQPAACEWTCNSDYAAENGACINSKQVACADAAPANATSSDALVWVSYTDEGGWAEPEGCEWTCNADYDEDDGACINSRTVACNPNAPANGTSEAGNVVITYSDAGGWTEPADCDFTCNVDYCRSGSSCTYAYDELEFSPSTNIGSAWFGGDDRPDFGPRNIGQGQRFVTDSAITMDRFAFYFTGSFRSSVNNTPRTVTVQLDFRNSSGTILRTAQATVSSSFTGGWVWFDVSNLNLAANTTYIATAWLVNGWNLGVNSGMRSNVGNADTSGYRYGARATSNAAMTNFADWSGTASSDWDYWYRVQSPPACAQP